MTFYHCMGVARSRMAFDLQNVHDSVKDYKPFFFSYVRRLNWFKLIEDLPGVP